MAVHIDAPHGHRHHLDLAFDNGSFHILFAFEFSRTQEKPVFYGFTTDDQWLIFFHLTTSDKLNQLEYVTLLQRLIVPMIPVDYFFIQFHDDSLVFLKRGSDQFFYLDALINFFYIAVNRNFHPASPALNFRNISLHIVAPTTGEVKG